MNYVWKLLLICSIIIIISFIIISIIDYRKYSKKRSLQESFIINENIPRITKTIHICSDISKINFLYTKGDIIEEDHGKFKLYYICCNNLEIKRLTITQVMNIEKQYKIKLLDWRR